MKRGKCRKATKGARPPRRRRWQTKSDGKGASAAEAKWILRAKRVKDERGLFFKNVANVHIGSVTNLYRLDFHFIPSSHFSSAVDAPSPSDFVCHLSRFIGRACPKGESKIFFQYVHNRVYAGKPLSPKGKARSYCRIIKK